MAGAAVSRITVPAIRSRKGATPIACLTCYTASTARVLDPHVDLLLVGDSLGMVVYGFDTTLPVTLDLMIAHGAAVVRGSQRACVIVDMPFGTYQESPGQAFRAAARVMAETGAAGVKLEGGVEMAETVAFLTARGIPVMGHVGLTPQSIQSFGTFRARGRDAAGAAAIQRDAEAIAASGAFAVVVECVMEPLARTITAAIPVPTIGIGASSACDGQVLVTEDLCGLFTTFTPKFVRTYAKVGETIAGAAAAYAADVRSRAFPGPEQCYFPPSETPPKGSPPTP